MNNTSMIVFAPLMNNIKGEHHTEASIVMGIILTALIITTGIALYKIIKHHI